MCRSVQLTEIEQLKATWSSDLNLSLFLSIFGASYFLFIESVKWVTVIFFIKPHADVFALQMNYLVMETFTYRWVNNLMKDLHNMSGEK